MCDICVTNAVKKKMLSRRDLFRGSAAMAAGAAAKTIGFWKICGMWICHVFASSR